MTRCPYCHQRILDDEQTCGRWDCGEKWRMENEPWTRPFVSDEPPDDYPRRGHDDRRKP